MASDMPGTGGAAVRRWTNRFHVTSDNAVWFAVIGVILIAGLLSPNFWQIEHLLNVSRQASGLAIATVGQTVVIITGGLDLSNGMVITLVDVVAAMLLNGDDTLIVPVVVLCLGIGVLVGLFNGFLVAKLRIPPLIGTLGTYGILRGLAYILTGGSPKGKIPPSLIFVGSGHVGPIPTAVICALVFIALGALVLHRTTLGRKIYAVGANRQAAFLSGVPVGRIVMAAYVISGVSAATAGLVLSGYIGVGSLSIGDGYNLNSIAAAVVGGALLTGGRGKIVGGAAGALFLALVVSLLRFLGLPYSNQLMVQGAILALAVFAHSRVSKPH